MECAMPFESLERRRLFSVTVTETFPGYYEIVGDASDDAIAVSVDQAGESLSLGGST
jgi:hypothetical protein